MTKSIPSIVDKMLEEYKISILSEKEQEAWKNEFQSLLNDGGLSSLEVETMPFKKDVVCINQEIETLLSEAKSLLSNDVKDMEPIFINLLFFKIESGILGGQKYSYRWRGQEIEEINPLSENDQKLLKGVNKVSKELCINTSAEIAALKAKKARIKEVLKISATCKEEYVPNNMETSNHSGADKPERESISSDDIWGKYWDLKNAGNKRDYAFKKVKQWLLDDLQFTKEEVKNRFNITLSMDTFFRSSTNNRP